MQARSQRRIIYASIGLLIVFFCGLGIVRLKASAPPKVELKYVIAGTGAHAFVGRPIDIFIQKYTPSPLRKIAWLFLWRKFGTGLVTSLDSTWPSTPGTLRLVTTGSGSLSYNRLARLYSSEGQVISEIVEGKPTEFCYTPVGTWRHYAFSNPPTNAVLVAKIFENTGTGAVQVAMFRFKNPFRPSS